MTKTVRACRCARSSRTTTKSSWLGTALTAVELAQKNKVDVALVDIVMARMSGIEVLERLKFVDPGDQVVMLTAFETTDLMRKALRGGACDYITKPFDVSTLRAAVATAMQRRTLAKRDPHPRREAAANGG